LKNIKKNILIYTDCPFFAGCENVISNLLNNKNFVTEHNITLCYSFSEKYKEGLKRKIKNVAYKEVEIKILKQYLFTNKSKLLRIIATPFNLIYKYFTIIFNSFLLFRIFKKNKIDILHINNGGYPAAYSCYSAVFASQLCSIKNIIYVVNNQAQDYKHPLRWADLLLDKYIINKVNYFVTGSINAGERLNKIIKISKDKLITINNGVTFNNLSGKLNFDLSNITNSKKLIALIGANLEKRKGHQVLLNSILSLKQKGLNNIYYIFAGNGPEYENVKKFIYINGLENDILLLSHYNDMYNLIKSIDFLILPSIENEDFPYIIIEAMSLSKPIIATNIAGIPEQVTNNENGILVKPKDSASLAEAIEFFSMNPSKLKEFGLNGKNKHLKKFTAEIVADKYSQLYSLLN
jgi:glycosyltransferase involved in cell wall biosynthesis